MFYWLFNWFVKITGFIPFFFIYRTKYYYIDKKRQSRKIKKKAIVMVNHHSIYDFAEMLFAFPSRTLRCLMSEAIFSKNKALTFLLKCFGGIKVDRETRDFTFINKSVSVLDKNGVIEIYPESRLALPGEEKPLEFKPSVVKIALESGASIIPVYHTGKMAKKERNRIMIGTPIDVVSLYDESLSEVENLKNVSQYLRQKVLELKDELERRINEEKK